MSCDRTCYLPIRFFFVTASLVCGAFSETIRARGAEGAAPDVRFATHLQLAKMARQWFFTVPSAKSQRRARPCPVHAPHASPRNTRVSRRRVRGSVATFELAGGRSGAGELALTTFRGHAGGGGAGGGGVFSPAGGGGGGGGGGGDGAGKPLGHAAPVANSNGLPPDPPPQAG